MLGLYEKTAAIRGRIDGIRSAYAGDSGIQAAIDAVDSEINGIEASAKGIVEEKLSGINHLSSEQCLGTQLPIPDIDGAFENFSKVLEALGGGAFLTSLDSKLDAFLSDLPGAAGALAEIRDFESMIQAKSGVIDSLMSTFSAFEGVQSKMSAALSTVGLFTGCADPATGASLGRHLERIDSAIGELNPDFKAGRDAVETAKQYFTEPGEILADAKARVTGALDLDGIMTGIKDEFNTGLGDLL
ncbi:MAG: hypothetical protein MI863_00395 [Desulfobacterales bacterium]|nr:hypothetical protein [Desulfobacterales bacterium]